MGTTYLVERLFWYLADSHLHLPFGRKWPTAGSHERLLRRSETQKTILGHAAALQKGVWPVRVGD